MKKIDYSKIIENENELEFYVQTRIKIINYLKQNNHSTFWEIVRNVQGSDRRVLRLLNQMLISKEIRKSDKNLFLNNEEITKNYITKTNDVLCNNCHGATVQIKDKYLDVLNKMQDIYQQKPIPTFLFDQRPVTSETTVKRVAYLALRGDLKNKRIVLIGDDDLTSIAIGLTHEAEEIVVFDVDKRLVEFINNHSKKMQLDITAHEIDLTKKIPLLFIDYFDVMLTDPTPTREAFSLFLSIGINLLKNKKGSIGYISFFPSHQKISWEFQKVFCDKNVIITDMIPKFTEYDFIKATYKKEDLKLLEQFDSGERRLSFHENLTRFETTEDTIREIKIPQDSEIKNFFGKSTKRVISNLKKDPAYIPKDKKYLDTIAHSIKEILK